MLTKENGFISITIGIIVFIFGAVFLFDRALMIAGNFVIIFGLGVLLKDQASKLFTLEKLQGTVIFLLGIFCLIMDSFILGFLLELLGVFLIIKSFIPDIRSTIISYFLKPTKKTK